MGKSKADKQMDDLLRTPVFNTYVVTMPSGHKINIPYHGELTPEMINRFDEAAKKHTITYLTFKKPTPAEQ